MQKRYLVKAVKADLARKMVFIGGPRQVGKTTLAQSLTTAKQGYLNWDIPTDRERILKRQLPVSSLWIFDEIHKYRLWRNYLKGLYDQFKNEQHILITGSARLDYYRFGGDSLQGRYHYLRLHPLSVAELGITNQKDLLELCTLGGFPEPYFSSSKIQAKRWSREYRNRLIREDLMDIEKVLDIGTLELLMMHLPERVGSPLSINSLREDLNVSHKAISHWLDILERLYAIFRLPPLGAPKLRAVKKERKHYQLDWSLVQEDGLRFENMVACHLQKWIHYEEDVMGRDLELRYFRDVDGREVDFVILENRQPIQMIECKWNDGELSKGLVYLKKRFPNASAWQISAIGSKDYLHENGIRVCPAHLLLKDFI